jgi:FdhE protein
MIEAPLPATGIQTILAGLDALCMEQPELASAAAYYRLVLPVLKEAQVTVPPFVLDETRALQKIEAGEPLLIGEDLPFTFPAISALFERICECMEIAADITSDIERAQSPKINHIRRVMAAKPGRLLLIIKASMVGDAGYLETLAKNLGMDFPLVQVVVQNCLKPYLHAWREGLSAIDIGLWNKGNCPFCGNWPVLAELQGSQRARHLRCGLCGADWPYNRLQCVYCGTTEIKSLGLMQVGEEPLRLSIQTCAACHGYVKTVVALEAAHPDLLPVEDLATLSLDLIAGERGYRRPARG